jgi:broad specificity phosphatase PhoE
LKDVIFNRIYSSPSLRCIETTNHFINQNINFNIRNQIIVLDDKLMELQGSHICNARKDRLILEKFMPNLDKVCDFSNVSLNYNKNSIENKERMNKRIIEFIDNLKNDCDNSDTILVVSHYMWLYNFFELIKGQGYEFSNSEIKIMEIPANV